MQASDIPAPADPRHYAPDEIILYGVKLNGASRGTHAAIVIDEPPSSPQKLELRLDVTRDDVVAEPGAVVIASVIAYAYEGYCYRFDKPKVLVFLYDRADEAAQGCGFEPPQEPRARGAAAAAGGYRMWRIRGKTQLLELGTRADLAEKVILESSLPGKQAPATYSLDMQMAHRGGRLTKP